VLVVEDVITTGGSVREVMNLVEDAGGNILGVGVLVDRSNGTVTLHNNQYSIVKLDAVSYGEDEVPIELDKIPIQKPGSRHLI
ncbi:MAG: phosphoribosyltransferase family protein, partial [Candidatus Neomarinimicrobiota bacterium]